MHHGNRKVCTLEEDFLVSGDYTTIRNAAEAIAGLVAKGALIRRGENVITSYSIHYTKLYEPSVRIVAPNRFVLQWVRERYVRRIGELGQEFYGAPVALALSLPPNGEA